MIRTRFNCLIRASPLRSHSSQSDLNIHTAAALLSEKSHTNHRAGCISAGTLDATTILAAHDDELAHGTVAIRCHDNVARRHNVGGPPGCARSVRRHTNYDSSS